MRAFDSFCFAAVLFVVFASGCAGSRKEAADRAAAMSAAAERISRLTMERNFWQGRADFEARRGEVLARKAYASGKTDGASAALGSVQCTLTTEWSTGGVHHVHYSAPAAK